MPQSITSYKVFISSPSDVSADRKVIKEAILACNKLVERRNVVFSPFMWEVDAVSGFGSPAQQQINEQLGEFDIYIGIMGESFGAPTAHFGSGTEEEFFLALERYKQGGMRRVSFLFKKTSIDASSLSSDQLLQIGKINQFRQDIQSLGLFGRYRDEASLREEVTKILFAALPPDGGASQIGDGNSSSGSGGQRSNHSISGTFKRDFLDSSDSNILIGNKVGSLEELWTDIDLQITTVNRGGGLKTEHASVASILPQILSGKCYNISGNETSGTTTICKRIYIDAHASGKTPVFLDGRKLKHSDVGRIDSRIATEIGAQYDGISQADARTLQKDDIIIIIDDFDMVSLTNKAALTLLDQLKRTYRSVIITTASSYTFSVLEAEEDIAALGAFVKAQVQDISHKNRYTLIERWYKASESITDEAKLLHKIEKARREISRVLTTNIVPRTPLIVLVLLKAIESEQTADLAQSGYVRYYKFLIDNAILRGMPLTEAEQAYAILPEIAWAIYNTEGKSISQNEIENIVKSFSERRALRQSGLYLVLEKLRTIGMFSEANSEVQFQHRYAYNFFLADYINQNIRSTDMQARVRLLCTETWSRERANILVFLSFFSESELITECLLHQLNEAYRGSAEFSFTDNKSAAINKLLIEAPKQVVDEDGAAEGRSTRLEAKDKAEQSLSSKNENESAPLGQMETVFAAVEVLGHILRNHYARMDAEPKRIILKAATAAMLRCLGSFFDRLSTSTELLIGAISLTFDRFQPHATSEEKEAAARGAVFIIALAFLYYCNRTLSQCVGDESLEITYSQVVLEDPTPTRSLIDIVIRLDAFRDFPENDLKKVAEILKGNHLGEAALRAFVSERLDFRPPGKAADFRRYCGIVGLNMKPRLVEQVRLGSRADQDKAPATRKKAKGIAS